MREKLLTELLNLLVVEQYLAISSYHMGEGYRIDVTIWGRTVNGLLLSAALSRCCN